MKKLILSLSVLATVALFSACTKSNDTTPTTANVMFVNGCAESSNIGISANNTAISSVQNLAFLSASGYQSVTAGTAVPVAFDITVSGSTSSAPLASGTLDLAVGDNYSVFAAGLVTSPSFFYTIDDLSAPTSGNAKIRLVNLSADSISLTGTVSLGSSTTTFGSGLKTGGVSSFTSIPAGSYKIVVADTTNESQTIAQPLSAQQLSAGKIYTVIYTGTLLGTGSFAYLTTVINNN